MTSVVQKLQCWLPEDSPGLSDLPAPGRAPMRMAWKDRRGQRETEGEGERDTWRDRQPETSRAQWLQSHYL